MRIKVTLRRSASSAQNIQVTADGTATVGDVAAALAAADPVNPRFAADARLTLRVVGGPVPTTLGAEASLLDSGLQSGSTIEIVERSATPRTVNKANAAAVLRVLGGPDERIEVLLPAGPSDIGRSADSTVRLTDPMVSKNHARVLVGRQIEVIDSNSANGVLVGGVKVARVTVGPDDDVTIGGTRFRVGHLGPVSEFGSTSTDIGFIRSPRVLERPVDRTVNLPDAPSEPAKVRFPVISMVAPLIMGAVLFATTRSALSLIFVGLSPLLMLGNYVDQRSQGKRKYQTEVANFTAALATARVDLERSQLAERSMLERLYPKVEVCTAAAFERNDIFWSRRAEHPEFLSVRLGTGTTTPRVRPELGREGLPEHTAKARELHDGFADLRDAAIVADLRSVGGLGVCGARGVVDGVARSLVMQIATLHSPAELAIACMTSARGVERWDWLEWLPHTSSPHSPLGGAPHLSADAAVGKVLLDLIEDLVTLRSSSGDAPTTLRGPIDSGEKLKPPPLPSVVLVVDEASLDAPRLIRIAERGPDVGIHVVWVAESKAGLPAACRTYLDVGRGMDVRAGMVRQGRVYDGVACETVPDSVARGIARAMAPVIDSGVPVEDDSDLPRSVSVVSLLGPEASDEAEVVLARWRENQSLIDRSGRPPVRRDRPSDLRAIVGHAGAEPFTVDLRGQGPHALVGGTTGAGKSEFLQAWVLGMAHAHSPDRVTFLFVDYKGGAAFAACEKLPHAVGMVTDLSSYLVRRALRSLRAELKYREHLLNRKGKKDLAELEMTGDPDCPPSLIIVVDEFAALAAEIPEFVDGVVDVAQRGRSLGLHLILATQRPAGVIKENLRANTNLRIALRMADEHDSVDVLGAPMAAFFDPGVPGRGVAKTGPGRLTQFQSAFPGARTPAQAPAPPIDVLELDFGRGGPWKMPPRLAIAESVPTDIERVVGAVTAAATLGKVPAPRRPWLDSLALTYDLIALDQGRDTRIVIGVVDDPDQQQQVHEFFRPDVDGNILYVGAGGSGKSTALRTLACAAAITQREGLAHVYGLDFAGGGMSALSVLPNVGSIVLGDDEERVGRLMRHLSSIIDERSQRFRELNAESLAKYREIANRPLEPRILLLLDGFGAFRSDYENTISLTPIYQAFQRILIDGRAVGVHVAMTADRPAVVPNSIGSAFQRKVVLRLADEDAYVAMGVPRDVLTTTSVPGRAIQVDRQLELQLAILGKDVSAAGQARMIDRVARDIAANHVDRPVKIAKLPSSISASTMPESVAGQPVLGIEDVRLRPVGFEPEGVLMLAGPSRSGRTTAIRWLAESVRRVHPTVPLVHCAPRRSPLSGLPLWTESASDVDSVASLLGRVLEYAVLPAENGTPGIAIFVESLPEFVSTAADSSMTDLIKHCRRNGHLLVAEGETTMWASIWQMVLEVRNAKTGLLLQPDQSDGDTLLRTTLPRVKRADYPPGRGFLVKGGRWTKVQLPLVD